MNRTTNAHKSVLRYVVDKGLNLSLELYIAKCLRQIAMRKTKCKGEGP